MNDEITIRIKGMETDKEARSRYYCLQKTLDDVQRSLGSLEIICKAQQALIEAQDAMLERILVAVTLRPATSGVLTWTVEGTTIKGANIVSKVAMGLVGLISAHLLNATGGPGAVDGIPVWTANPEGVVTLKPAADGLSCEVETLPVTIETAVVVTFDADADLGEGTKDLKFTATLTVYNPDAAATTGDLTVGNFAAKPVV